MPYTLYFLERNLLPMNQINIFENAFVEIIHFEEVDMICTSGNQDIVLPPDEFSLRRPSLDFLSALENAENK